MNSNTDTSRSTKASAPVALHARTSVEQVEEGRELAPKFDQDGLIACITTDADSGDVLMLGYMNHEALVKTVQTGKRTTGVDRGKRCGTKGQPAAWCR